MPCIDFDRIDVEAHAEKEKSERDIHDEHLVGDTRLVEDGYA